MLVWYIRYNQLTNTDRFLLTNVFFLFQVPYDIE